MLSASLRLTVWWLAAVLVATFANYPGVVCITPLAWLLALRVGLDCAARSANPSAGWRVVEAALAGGFMGMLQGILFLVIAPRLGEIAPDERVSALVIGVGMLLVGGLVGAGLAAFNAWLYEQRTKAMKIEKGETL
jgi:hypothetical protein